jgi:hypothetical protein
MPKNSKKLRLMSDDQRVAPSCAKVSNEESNLTAPDMRPDLGPTFQPENVVFRPTELHGALIQSSEVFG